MDKFFEGNKIAWAGWASVICIIWKIYKCFLHQIAREIMLVLVENLHQKNIAESQDRQNFESVHVLFVILL